MPDKTEAELRQQGLTAKQARAVMKEREKKKKAKNAAGKIKAATDEKNKALDDIYNW